MIIGSQRHQDWKLLNRDLGMTYVESLPLTRRNFHCADRRSGSPLDRYPAYKDRQAIRRAFSLAPVEIPLVVSRKRQRSGQSLEVISDGAACFFLLLS